MKNRCLIPSTKNYFKRLAAFKHKQHHTLLLHSVLSTKSNHRTYKAVRDLARLLHALRAEVLFVFTIRRFFPSPFRILRCLISIFITFEGRRPAKGEIYDVPLANPSREVAWRRIVYLGMQLIHRTAERK